MDHEKLARMQNAVRIGASSYEPRLQLRLPARTCSTVPSMLTMSQGKHFFFFSALSNLLAKHRLRYHAAPRSFPLLIFNGHRTTLST